MNEYQNDCNYFIDEDDENNNKIQNECKTKKVTYKKIHDLYKIINQFKKGKKIVEESSVFTYLTEEIFIDWIISSNPNIKIYPS